MTRFLRLIRKNPQLFDIIILILGFTSGANLYVFFKISGMSEENGSEMLSQHGFHWMTPTAAGLIIGVGFGLLEYRYFNQFAGNRPGILFLVKFVTYSLIIIITAVIAQVFVGLVLFNYSTNMALEKAEYFIRTDIFLSLYIYLLILGFTLNFIRVVGNRFGHGVIFNYMSGKYRKPIQEDRVFMFLDLNNSTTIAEVLGHINYSRLLIKCFDDLTNLIDKYDAEIYQYVGDEVVLTWNTKRFKKLHSPCDLFYDFVESLSQKAGYYSDRFGCEPSFKASINAGEVSVSEVGQRKKEIAYHGDVLNTAARLLELCKNFNHQLLATENILKIIDLSKDLEKEFVTTINLRGKKEVVSIFGIKKVVSK